MASNRRGQYKAKALAREPVLVSFHVDINGTSNPDGLYDPGKAVKTVVRDSQGRFTATLNDRYAKIHALANIGVTGDRHATVDVITDGYSAANTLQITTLVGASADDPADNSRLSVLAVCYLY